MGFWEQEILAKHTAAERSKLLGWVRGVKVHEFIGVNATGTFLGKAHHGADITPAEFDNHVKAEYRPWVSEEIEKLRVKGCIIRWADLVDVSSHPKPNNVLPLAEESTKLRLFWDGRWLNKCADTLLGAWIWSER